MPHRTSERSPFMYNPTWRTTKLPRPLPLILIMPSMFKYDCHIHSEKDQLRCMEGRTMCKQSQCDWQILLNRHPSHCSTDSGSCNRFFLYLVTPKLLCAIPKYFSRFCLLPLFVWSYLVAKRKKKPLRSRVFATQRWMSMGHTRRWSFPLKQV